jgi:hypothetical protein
VCTLKWIPNIEDTWGFFFFVRHNYLVQTLLCQIATISIRFLFIIYMQFYFNIQHVNAIHQYVIWKKFSLNKFSTHALSFRNIGFPKRLVFLSLFLIPGRWVESENPIFLEVIHHRQNPIVTTCTVLFTSQLPFYNSKVSCCVNVSLVL